MKNESANYQALVIDLMDKFGLRPERIAIDVGVTNDRIYVWRRGGAKPTRYYRDRLIRYHARQKAKWEAKHPLDGIVGMFTIGECEPPLEPGNEKVGEEP